MTRLTAFLSFATLIGIAGDASAQSRERESRGQGGDRPRSREERPREIPQRPVEPRNPVFPVRDARRDQPPSREPDPAPRRDGNDRSGDRGQGRLPDRGPAERPNPPAVPATPPALPRSPRTSEPGDDRRRDFPPSQGDRRGDFPPNQIDRRENRDPRDVREVRDREGRVWEERRWGDSRSQDPRSDARGRHGGHPFEVRDREGWRYAPPVRSRETIVLRESRPYGRPWIVYPTRWGFGGLWNDYSWSSVYSFSGITIVESSWCPGRGRFAYVELLGGRRQVRVYEPGWAAPRPLLSGFDSVSYLSWSPDGRYLAFVTRSGGEDCLHLLDTVTDRVDRITYGFPRCAFPTWHPSGRFLYFLSDRYGPGGLFRIAPWGGAPVACDGFPVGPVQRLLMSPDGNTLLFGMGLGSNRTEIWSYRTDLAFPARPVLRVDGAFDHPGFVPDGDRVLFMGSGVGNGTGWYSFRLDGGDLRFHGNDPGRFP